MLLTWDALAQCDFLLSDIKLLRRMPTYRTFSLKHRRISGFIYIIEGTCILESDGEEIFLAPGALIYLPAGSHHAMTVTSEEIEFYRIDFTVTVDGEVTLFSNRPTKLADAVSAKCYEAMAALEQECIHGDNRIVKVEKLCAIFSTLCTASPTSHCKKLEAAIHYLDAHFTENVSCHHLAALCFLSTAQFYNLFRERLGMTPLEYRDRLLLRHAKAMLETGEATITEVANTLGFTSVAYFSRFFKKHTGTSPSAYTGQSKDL